MDHIAIMQPSWRFIEKILSGEKTIESRWYMTRRAPWKMIAPGDTVYFKDAGKDVMARAVVAEALFFSDLNPKKVKSLLSKHGRAIGIPSSRRREFLLSVEHKKYCILIILSHPEKIRAFSIDKRGFGAQAAWITVPDIRKIKRV